MRIFPCVKCAPGSQEDLYPQQPLPTHDNCPKLQIPNQQLKIPSSANPRLAAWLLIPLGDQDCSKVQWGYWGTSKVNTDIFRANELWVQLWTQFHSQPGCLKEYLWMTLGFCLLMKLIESWSTPGPRFQKGDFRPVWPSQRPLSDWQPSPLTALLHPLQYLSPPHRPHPSPSLHGATSTSNPDDYLLSTSAQVLNLRKDSLFSALVYLWNLPRTMILFQTLSELQSLKSTVEHQLTIGIKNWSVVSWVPEIST